MFVLLCLLLAPADAASLGKFVTSVNAIGDEAIGMSGSMETRFKVWPMQVSAQNIQTQLKNLDAHKQAYNQVLLTLVNSSFQDALGQVMYHGEKDSSEPVRRMLGFVGVTLDHIVREKGQALAKIAFMSKQKVDLEIYFPKEKIVLGCSYKPTTEKPKL